METLIYGLAIIGLYEVLSLIHEFVKLGAEWLRVSMLKKRTGYNEGPE